MKLLLFFLLGFTLLISGCKKDKLPTFYFQCKVDGVLYEPDNCANCNTKDMYADTIMIIGASRGNEAIGLGFMKHNLGIGTYTLLKNITEGNGTGSYDNTIGNPTDIFRTDSLRSGTINITELDKSNKIIEGSFAFDAFNISQNKIVKITQGKFRLKYRIY